MTHPNQLADELDACMIRGDLIFNEEFSLLNRKNFAIGALADAISEYGFATLNACVHNMTVAVKS